MAQKLSAGLKVLHATKQIALALLVAVLAAFLFVFVLSTRPPKEWQLIQNFQNHRASYERLRNMLLADEGLIRVATWGVETTNHVSSKPPEGTFPVARYNEYLSLLKDIDAEVAFREERQNPDVGVVVWASGWAGNIRHIDICWLTQEPKNTVASLDDFHKRPVPRQPVFRHLDGNWYLWADW